MNQVKTGSFLKELRKEKNLTQENLAEQLNVSNRTVSRWETGSNMPDISTLVEIAEFFDVSIPEIIDGERKSEKMNQETKETAAAMAEYSHHEVRSGKRKILGALLSAFGLFIIISALAIIPSESSWSSIYAVLGSIVLVIGISIIARQKTVKKSLRIITVVGCIALLFGAFTAFDYIAVTQYNQVPRFRYKTEWSSENPDQLIHKTLFYTVVQENSGTKDQKVYIKKNKCICQR